VVNRAFYALHNTKIPFVVAIISATMYVVGASLSVFVFKWNVVGLGLIMSIASISQFVILLLLLLKKIDGFAAKMLIKPMVKMISASLLMAVCLWIPMRLLDNVLDTTRVVPLILLTVLASLSGALVYLGFAKVLHIKELAIFMELLKKVGNWRSVLTKSDAVLEIPTQSQDIKPL
jgi:putative peptidoglycan lipid II flippase